MLRERQRAPRFLTLQQIDAVMAAAEMRSSTSALFFGLGIFAGFRKLEADRARVGWVDMDQGVVYVREEKDFVPKDAENRFIPLHDRLRDIVARHAQGTGYLLAPSIQPGRDAYRYDIRYSFGCVLEAAGLAERYKTRKATRWHTWVTPHVLRHTFASQLVMAGVSIYKVARWMGHADIKTTMVYAHLAPRDEDINRF